MPRVKRGPKRKNRRVRVLKLAKGYYGTKHNCFRIAELQVERSLVYATRDRKQKKREFRGLWIVRINAAARQHDLSYSKLMAGLKKAGSDVNRKVLAEIAVEDPKGFANIVASAKTALGLPADRDRERLDPPRVADLLASVEEKRRVFFEELKTAEERASSGGGLLPADVRALHVRWLGQKQGIVTELLAGLRTLSKEDKAAAGAAINRLKKDAEAALSSLEERSLLFERSQKQRALAVDVTLPPRSPARRTAAPAHDREAANRRRLRVSGLRDRARPGRRDGLAELRGAQLSARPSGARRRGHVLPEGRRRRPRPAAPAHAHVAGPDPDDARAEAAHPDRHPGPRLPEGRHRSAPLARLPPDGGAHGGRGHDVRRPEGHARGVRAPALHARDEDPVRPDVLPFRRAGRGRGRLVRLLQGDGRGGRVPRAARARAPAGSRSWARGWSIPPC